MSLSCLSCGNLNISDLPLTSHSHSQLHTLHTRELSATTASSFIIIVTVGFVGLLMICAGSSSYYRRRVARDQVLSPMSRRVSSNVPLEEPRLWEVTVPNWDKTYDHQRGDEEWENTLPLAVKLVCDPLSVDRNEKISEVESRRIGQRGTLMRNKSGNKRASSIPMPVRTINRAEIALLIVMPIGRSSSVCPRSGGQASLLPQDGGNSGLQYAVGTTEIPCRGIGVEASTMIS